MDESPILIAGPPRSGNTWMQHALDLHPLLAIRGHFPRLTGDDLQNWLEKLLAAGELAARWNESLAYQVPHFAGASEQTTLEAFRGMLRQLWIGDLGRRPARWGASIKWEPPAMWKRLWPAARFVICLRDPFKALESATNNFTSPVGPRAFLERWVAAAKFGLAGERATCWLTDQVAGWTRQERREAMAILLEWLELPEDAAVLKFAADYPRIHGLKPRAEYQFTVTAQQRANYLERVPELRATMARLMYAVD